MKHIKKHLLFATLLFAMVGTATITFGQASDSNSATAAASPPAGVPRLVQFSSIAQDANGKPQTGTIGITFLLYQSEQGGAPLWMETQNVQADAKGHYSVQLGATKPDGLPEDLFNSAEARWLGVQIADQNEQPRVLLLAVPYALKAGDASTIGGLPPSAFVRINPEDALSADSKSIGASSSGNTSTAGSQNPLEAQTLLAVKTPSPGQTIGFVPLWTGSKSPTTEIGSSNLFQSGSNIGIGTTTPSTLLDVNGNGSITGTLTVTSLTASSTVQGEFGSFTAPNVGSVLTVENTSTSTSGTGIVGNSTASGGIGVEGNADGSSAIGVEGNADGSTAIGVAGLGVNGVGVQGQVSGTGAGVLGLGGEVGVVGRAPGIGMEAIGTSSTNSQGIYAQGSNYGVIAAAFSTASGFQEGVQGSAAGPTGIGGLFIGNVTSKTGGNLEGCCPAGVWGDTGSSAGGAAGLVGTADEGQALFLENNSTTALTASITNLESSTHDVAILNVAGAFGSCNMNSDGVLFCTAPESLGAPVDNNGREVALYAVASPQNWFEDFGSGQLASGGATVALDPTFAGTVNTSADYHVFLTPEGDCRGLYVSNKSAAGFEVHELGGGQSSVGFSYRIVALRRGYETLRLEDKTEMLAKLKAQMPKPLATPHERWVPPARPEPISLPAPPTVNAGQAASLHPAAATTK